ARSLLRMAFLIVSILAGVIGVSGAELSGRVTNVCGLDVPGAVIVLENFRSGTEFRTTAVTEGRYTFHDIPPSDSWVLSVRAFGFENAQEDVLLGEDAPLERNVRLLPDLTRKETLIVSAGDPAIRFH